MTNETMSCNFHVGQKVVCVDSQWHDNHTRVLVCPLELNKIYTVVELKVTDERSIYKGIRSGRVNVLLAEVENPYVASDGFDARRFLPAVTRKTDISVFKAMLKPSNQRVSA